MPSTHSGNACRWIEKLFHVDCPLQIGEQMLDIEEGGLKRGRGPGKRDQVCEEDIEMESLEKWNHSD